MLYFHYNKISRSKGPYCIYKIPVLVLQCKKCKWAQYIGETQETLETRIGQHLGYISRHEQDKPAGRHFNLKGHSAADMEVQVLEKVH